MREVVDRSTADKVAEATNLSALLDKNNKSEQVNTTQIISDNNETDKLTFRQMLEENNKKIKLEIMATLKLTMEENSKTLNNKIDSKMETIFKEFQTYLMRSTTKLVPRL